MQEKTTSFEQVQLRTKRSRGESTRRAILAAARQEFASKGFSGGSMRSIARQLGFEIGHIQHHFADKETLWSAVLAEVLGRHRQELDRLYEANRDLLPEERLAGFIESLVRYAAAEPHFVALMSQARTFDADGAAAYRAELNPVLQHAAALIGQAQQRGRFVPGNPVLLFYQMVGAALRIFTAEGDIAAIIGHSPRRPDVIAEHIQTCISVFIPGSPLPATTIPTIDVAPCNYDLQAAIGEERYPSMVYLVAQLDNLVADTLNGALQEIGLTRSQMMTFVRIAAEHRPSAAKIAKVLHVSPQSTMVTIRALEDRGLIRRHHHDVCRRVLPIALTASGRKVLERLRSAVAAVEADLTEDLSPRDKLALHDSLVRIIRQKRPLALVGWSPLL